MALLYNKDNSFIKMANDNSLSAATAMTMTKETNFVDILCTCLSVWARTQSLCHRYYIIIVITVFNLHCFIISWAFWCTDTREKLTSDDNKIDNLTLILSLQYLCM